MSTNSVSAKQINREWQIIDAKDQILGRLACEIAVKLSGKSKTNFVPYLDMGDFVVVTNAKEIKVTGKKRSQKLYRRHSGFPGGLTTVNFEKMMEKKPKEIIRHAVRGMLPKTKLGDKMIKKLYIYEGADHPHKVGVKNNG